MRKQSAVHGRPRPGSLRRSGQTLVEYSLVLAIISIVMISVMSLLGKRVVVVVSAITSLLDTAQISHYPFPAPT